MFKTTEHKDEPLLMDLKENKIEHNGFMGQQLWKSVYESARHFSSVNKLVSGVHSCINMLLAKTWIEKSSTSLVGIPKNSLSTT